MAPFKYGILIILLTTIHATAETSNTNKSKWMSDVKLGKSCDAIFEGLLKVCHENLAICRCRSDWKSKPHARYAAAIAGGHRTFVFTFPTYEQYVMKPNSNAIDSVYVIPAHGASNRTIADILSILDRHASAYLVHFTNISETMKDYCNRKGRSYTQNLATLDSIQAKRDHGGIVDMWTQVQVANKIINNMARARAKPYTLVLKTRPDILYLTALKLDTLVDNALLLDRPFFNAVNGLRDISNVTKFQIPYVVNQRDPSAFFPSCAGFGGLTDRLFVGPPAYMDTLLNAEWLKDWISADPGLMAKVRPGEFHHRPYRRNTGVEGYVKSWVDWNHIPVAELPATTLVYPNTQNNASRSQNSQIGDSKGIIIEGFVWAILRTKHLATYCNHSLDVLSWTDAACILENPKDVRRALKRNHFSENADVIKDVCDRYRHTFEPKTVLGHRGCVLMPSNSRSQPESVEEIYKNASKCSFETLWALGEPIRWSSFDTIKRYPAFVNYVSKIFSKLSSSNFTVAV
jgi:hypothetical protein